MNILKIMGIGILLALSSGIQAQVKVNVGTPPQWGPAGHSQVRYYYLPDVEAYYDVHSSSFIYYEGGSWVRRPHLPGRHRNYDLYRGYKVVMTDYHGNSPYSNHNSFKMKYKKGYHGGNQKTIGQKPGNGNSNGKVHSAAPSNSHQPKQNNNHHSGQGNVKGGSQGNNQNMQNHQGGNGAKGKKK
jgi:hypothetical protein